MLAVLWEGWTPEVHLSWKVIFFIKWDMVQGPPGREEAGWKLKPLGGLYGRPEGWESGL